MGRFRTGRDLAKMSWSVIRKEKSLLVFPIISAFVTLMIAASFFLPLWFLTGGDAFTQWYAWVMIFVWYILAFTVSIFCNVALMANATKVMEGENPTVGYGLGFAASRFKYILEWAIFSAIVGVILQAIRKQGGLLGNIAAAVIGAAWAVATYFVVPIMAFEKLGPLGAVKRSLLFLRSNWGEGLIANLSIGLVFFLLALAGFIPIIIGVLLFGSMGVGAVIAGFAIAIIYWVILAVIASAMKQVVVAAMYRYATTGKSYMGLEQKFPLHQSQQQTGPKTW
ncbi:MAG: hypothetical protein A4E32_01459 [Methanomassiliicoccales archaeon PtaU1.Bin124]|nr:MAG: hypothetical protein A4E32_01459 [Methanomassiliicoccales archaeon PtaU1.Bin124]